MEGFHDEGKVSSHAVLRAEVRKLGVLKLLNLWQLALLHLAIYQVACLYSWCCNSKTGRMLHINTWAEPGSLYVCVCVLQRNLMVAKHLVKARASDTPTPISMFGPDR